MTNSSGEELASELGLTIGTLRVRINRIKKIQ
jgi:hypothetical protein